MRIHKWLSFLENINENPVSDISTYNQKMKNAFFDKLFFIGKIKFDSIVDFGCADGFLLEKINRLVTSANLFGFDVDPTEVQLARNRLGDKAIITSKWSDIINNIEGDNPTILLSSVIHEVYSYDGKSIDKFWKEYVFSPKFKYIVIRDMITSDDIDSVDNYIGDVKRVKSKINNKYISDFENIWGKLEDSYKQFTHFLLKYKYINNWNREVRENYLPITISDLKSKIPKGYEIVYENNFILPYLQQEVDRDFKIKFKKPTHTKMIIKNNNYNEN